MPKRAGEPDGGAEGKGRETELCWEPGIVSDPNGIREPDGVVCVAAGLDVPRGSNAIDAGFGTVEPDGVVRGPEMVEPDGVARGLEIEGPVALIATC